MKMHEDAKKAEHGPMHHKKMHDHHLSEAKKHAGQMVKVAKAVKMQNAKAPKAK